MRGRAVRKLVGLITRRPQVRILPPLLINQLMPEQVPAPAFVFDPMKKKTALIFLMTLLLCGACVPCRPVMITSRPPGARIYLSVPDSYNPSIRQGPSRWELLGEAPLKESSCGLRGDIRADYEGRELLLFEYTGGEEAIFDFIENRVMVK